MKRVSVLIFFLFCSLAMFAQTFTVKGKVLDKGNRETLPGASVLVEGTTTGVTTDIDGNFQLNVPDKNKKIVVSFVGFKTQTLGVSENMTILLESDAQALDEVVVVGYGTMRKSDLTGSVSRIDADKMKQLSTVDVAQSIQGRVAGVNVVSNSGEPGAGTKIRIRGVGTVNNSDPLFIVDGFPVSDISHVAPNDIESMEVLKDASATAIYGSRGANGVIMVKTKNGARGKKAVVSVNAYTSFSDVVKHIDVLNASEYAELKAESYANADRDLDQNSAAIFKYVQDNNLKGTDWQDEILRTGISQNYNINVTGGGEKNSYDIGATYSRENGTVKYTSMEKFMLHANNEYAFSDKVKLGVNLSYTNYTKSGNNNDFYGGSLTSALKTDPISAAWDNYRDDFGEVYFTYGTNPARSVYENKYRTNGQHSVLGNAFLQIDDILIKGLSFRAQFGERMAFGKNRNYSPVYYVSATQKRDKSSLSEQRAETFDWSTTEYLSYNNSFGKHNVNMTLGFEAQKFKSNNIFLKVYDVPEDFNMQYISAAADKELFESSGDASHSALVSYFYRANYTYDNRYLFTATIRADGSSRFKERWGYFPSFSAGWNLHQEKFFQEGKINKVMSQLKVRAGWGQVGNQSSAGYNDYVALMRNGYTYVFGGVPVDGAIQEMAANEELSWETAEQYNFGVDFGFFENKLTGNIDYFIRNTNDMILPTPIPMYAGMWRPRTNAGSIRNSGVEFTLNYGNTVKEFSYNVGFNMSFIKNEVINIGGGDPIYGGSVSKVGNTTKTEVGRELGYFYGLQTDGIFHTQSELDAHVDKDGKKIQPSAGLGDVKFIDRNLDGKIDGDDRTYLGSAMPDVTFGLNANFAYKGFDLNLFLQGTLGNEIINGMYNTLHSSDMLEYSGSKDMMNRWTEQNPYSNTPRVHAGDPNKNTQFSDRYVENGSYLRLKNVQLGYTLPERLTRKIALFQLRFYVSADNLFTITKYSGFDPEVGDLNGDPLGAGIDLATYPVPRVLTVGLNLKF